MTNWCVEESVNHDVLLTESAAVVPGVSVPHRGRGDAHPQSAHEGGTRVSPCRPSNA